MRPKDLCLCAGMCAGVAAATAQQERPALQRLDNAIEVVPQRVAKARYVEGEFRVVSEWGGYSRPPDPCRYRFSRVFDCFGDNDSDGYMDDTGGCFTNSTSRWYFGTGYCNMFTTADHTVASGTYLDSGFKRVDLAWMWSCNELESCIIAVFTQDAVPCDPDSFDYSGWIFDFGPLSCNPGGYYFANIALSSGEWPIPTGGTGSHILFFAQGQTSSGALVPATCAQPMLWGTEYGGDNQRGTQATEQFDDVATIDSTHTTSECYTYSFGLCPDPLGAMVQFWGEDGSDRSCEYANYNDDSVIDSRDVLAYLNSWNALDGIADCNCDSTVNTQDVLCFLNLWNICR